MADSENPYAPPSVIDDAPAGAGGLVFSPEGAAVVSSLAKWMRSLGLIYYIGAGAVVLGGCGLLISGAGGAEKVGVTIGLGIVLVGIFAAATWVRESGEAFERGVMADDELTVGAGFRALRKYLILFGVVGLFQALFSLVGLLGSL